jgi:hypothetical protein
MRWKCAIAAAAVSVVLAPSLAQADMTAVENARAKERAGAYLSPQDRENLRRYGGNDSYGYGYSYDGAYAYGDGYYDDDGYDYDYGPGVSFYLGY